MTIKRPRATGYYAKFHEREYHATVSGDTDVILRSYRGEPPAEGFQPSQIPSVQGIKMVKRSELEQLTFVRTVCQWQGEPFVVVGADGETLDVFYTGNRGEWMTHQPGMVRTGKLETHGRLHISNVSEIYEFVDTLIPTQAPQPEP